MKKKLMKDMTEHERLDYKLGLIYEKIESIEQDVYSIKMMLEQ